MVSPPELRYFCSMLFLQGMIDPFVVQRRTRSDESTRLNSNAYKYYILVDKVKQQMCLNEFVTLYAVSVKRVRQLQNLAVVGKSPVITEENVLALFQIFTLFHYNSRKKVKF